MPTSANCSKNPSDVRADVGIRASILPLPQQPLLDTATNGEKVWRSAGLRHGRPVWCSCKCAVPEADAPMVVSRGPRLSPLSFG